jgi:hypothetical protein
MRRTIGAGLTLIVFLFLFSQTVVPQELLPIIVRTRSGLVQGEISGLLRSFRGIPYAAPPVGALRWRPPARVVSWNNVRDASAFAEMCIQINANGNLVGSEDCLTLNVFTASTAPIQSQPVMVFFHGGGNKRGSAQQPWFDHPQLAMQGHRRYCRLPPWGVGVSLPTRCFQSRVGARRATTDSWTRSRP